MIDCVGPARQKARAMLEARHPELASDTAVHLCWIEDFGRMPPAEANGWFAWWQGSRLFDRGVPTATGIRATGEQLDAWAAVRRAVET